jgi:hypothetical protein
MNIGLIGYNCRTGLGELNRQLATYCIATSSYPGIVKWLVMPHPIKPLVPFESRIEQTYYNFEFDVFDWLKDIDILLFAETPYIRSLPQLAMSQNKKVVCIPMYEWLPDRDDAWTKYVDQFICPTSHCYRVLTDKSSGIDPRKCVVFKWPTEPERFKFVERSSCNRFLFLNGNGGWQGRKGSKVIEELLNIWPEAPLLIRSQKTFSLGNSTIEIRLEETDNRALYSVGDVLICPHSIDGLGLEPLEAACVGIPSIITAGAPWDDLSRFSVDRVNASSSQRRMQRLVDWYEPSAIHLKEICEKILGQKMDHISRYVREQAEGRAWERLKDSFLSLVISKTNATTTFIN